MKILIVGGGPAGLYFAILMKKLDPRNEITIFERDGPADTYGWGIVFSDQTFSYLQDSDEPSWCGIAAACETWDNVDVVRSDGRVSVRGNKFAGLARLTFLNILHKRALDLGVDIRFRTNIADLATLPDHDLLVGADGANSLVRRSLADVFQPQLATGRNKYVWLGTPTLFHGLTLTFRQNDNGLFVAHSYKFNKTMSTFIVECGEDTWERAGFETRSDEDTCTYLARVFEDDLAGQPLLANNFVRWINFLLVKNRRWHHERAVLLGDALHTAHFSIGSGTKLALEDAIALARCFERHCDLPDVLEMFESTRRPIIEAYQVAADESRLWFENARDDIHLEALPFAYALMTRSKKITYDNLKQRDPEFIAAFDRVSRRGGPG